MEAKIVIFEGIDGSGKDTLIRAFHLRTNWRHLVLNRGPASYVVYGKLYGRDLDYDDYFEFDKQLSRLGAIRIYLEASRNVIIKRNIDKGDRDIRFDDIGGIVVLYESFLQHSVMKTIRIDTDKNTINECIGMILKEVAKHG